MKSTKILALLLAVLMVLPLVFSGCAKDDGGKKGGPSVVDETKEEVDQSKVYDAKVHDLHGHEFYFLARSTPNQHLMVNEIYAEELTGDKVNDAVFKRNSQLEDKYNCKIYQELNENPAAAVKEQLIAGEYQYDYIYAGVSQLRTLTSSNLLVDFKELDNVDLSKAWWDHNAIEGLSIAGKAFYGVGEAGTMDERASWAIYFNKDVLDQAGLESPYPLVREGKWTVDKLVEYMTATAMDLDGNGIMEIGKDRFGYIGEPLNNWFHVAACNCRLSTVSSSGDIELPGTVNKDVLDAWKTLKPLLTSDLRIVADTGFSNGGGVFYCCLSAVILNIAQKAPFAWGVLPMPKRNEEQEDYWTSFNSGWCYGYAIPVTTDSTPDYEENGFDSGREQAGYFLEAFSYYSMGTLSVAYYEQVIKGQSIKDADSVEMLDIALKNKVYDPVVIFDFGRIGYSIFREAGSEGGKSGGQGTATKGSDVNYDTLVSLYEARLNAARKQLGKYIDYLTAED